jgi:hypothetical protein
VAAGAGLALTSGNTDTSTVNASYDITYDPQTRNVVKSDGLAIAFIVRSSSAGFDVMPGTMGFIRTPAASLPTSSSDQRGRSGEERSASSVFQKCRRVVHSHVLF